MKQLNTVFASALAATAVALAFPAMGSAAEREWDIGAYDQCMADGIGKGHDAQDAKNHEALCCWASGGDWNIALGKCQAPPANQQASRPSIAQQGDIPNYTLEPTPSRVTRMPVGVITATLEPASAS